MTVRTRTAMIAALILCQVGFGTAAAYVYVTSGPPSVPAMPQRADATPFDAARSLETAMAQAVIWAPGAALVDEVVWLSWPVAAPDASEMSAPVHGWTTFVFASGDQRLALVIDRGSGFILGQHPKTLGLPAAGSLDLFRATISAETAAVAAEALGGSDYRAACPDHRNQTKVGATIDGTSRALLWVVTYADDRSVSLPDIIVALDATTGAVVRKTIAQPACAKS